MRAGEGFEKLPVIGHAFVGLGTAMCAKPATHRLSSLPLWTPAVVGLAYLPDVAPQLASLAGLPNARVATHSLLFAIVATPLAAMVLARVGSISLLRAMVVSVVSIVTHDLLDLLQSTDRRPWWPLSDRVITLDLQIIPVNSRLELLVFAGAFCLVAVGWAIFGRDRSRAESATRPRMRWLSYGLTAGILLCASGTHYFRDVRQSEADRVLALLAEGKIEAAVSLLETAERWPTGGKPGRLDYAVAEALRLRDDRDGSEYYYLRSCQANPSYFWAVADLAVLYASSDGPVAERRLKVEPYVRRLREDFADHEGQARVLAKIERKLKDGVDGGGRG